MQVAPGPFARIKAGYDRKAAPGKTRGLPSRKKSTIFQPKRG